MKELHKRRKSWARIVNATFANQKHGIVNMEANVAFNIFAPDLLLSYYIFATYLPRANLRKSFFRPVIFNTVTRYFDFFNGFQSKIF